MKYKMLLCSAIFVSGCATLTSDPMVPVNVGFSDGSEGSCSFNNKRGAWNVSVPGTASVRRSDDSLRYTCTTKDGRQANGAMQSEYGAKHMASVVFIDFGITDAITDKHRNYAASLVIPIAAKKAADTPEQKLSGIDSYEKLNQLSELRDKNIITQEEFESEKKKILAQ